MRILNFSDIRVLIFGALVTIGVLGYGWWKKKSYPSAILLFIYLGLLIIHLITMSNKVNIYVDFIGITVSITTYLIIDEIEIRRKKINQVFEDKYK